MAAGIDDARGDAVVVQTLDSVGAPASLPAPVTSAPSGEETSSAITKAPAAVATTSILSPMLIIAAGLAVVLLAIVTLFQQRRRVVVTSLSPDERERLLAEIASTLNHEPAMTTVRPRT
jgi:beta-lactamase regulating signal transducer with metallopeptidase domain